MHSVVQDVRFAFRTLLKRPGLGCVVIEGAPPAPGRDSQLLSYNVVGPDYFNTLSIPLLRGRAFRGQDQQETPDVAIINETMAHRFWPDEDVIGRRLRFLAFQGWCEAEVVGLVKDSKYHSLREGLKPHFYVPFSQHYLPAATLHVRTVSDRQDIQAAVLGEVHRLDANLPLIAVEPLAEHVTASVLRTRTVAGALTASATVSLILAVAGLYSLMAYSVSRRNHEIGVRMALGAQRGDVLRLVLRQTLSLVVAGIGIGIVVALVSTHVLSGLLYGVSTTDPATFVGVALLVSVVALLAGYVPARRAARVDPMVALRHE